MTAAARERTVRAANASTTSAANPKRYVQLSAAMNTLPREAFVPAEARVLVRMLRRS